MASGNITLYGRRFNISGPDNDEYFKNMINDDGSIEEDILNLYAAIIDDSDCVLDVGANLGLMTLAFASLLEKGKVFSFEPNSDIYSFLTLNIKSNHINNVTPYKLGLSNKEITATMTYNKDNSSGGFVNSKVITEYEGHKNTEIKLAALDDVYKKLGIKKCRLIKVDIEGHEPSFLQGARSFIDKYKTEALIEVNHWCLNIFSRLSLPDYLDQLYDTFPYVFAFYNGKYLDLSNDQSRYFFYYNNTVNNTYTNVYCGFNKKEMLKNLNSAFRAKDINERSSTEKKNSAEEVAKLQNELDQIKKSRSLFIAKKLNRIIGR